MLLYRGEVTDSGSCTRQGGIGGIFQIVGATLGQQFHLSLDAAAISSSIGVRIQALVSTQAGMGLDNVILTSAVPEPSTYGLMIAGLVGAGAVARRRSQRA